MSHSRRSSIHNEQVEDERNIDRVRKDLTDLLLWLSELGIIDVPEDLTELCTAHAFAKILNTIDYEFFDECWLKSISDKESKHNTVVKQSNIRMLCRKIMNYVNNKLNRTVSSTRWNNIDERVTGDEGTDLPVALDLTMLIVTVAHDGSSKKQFIDHSTQMLKKHPTTMETIARILNKIFNEIPKKEGNDENEIDEEIGEDNISRRMSLSDSNFEGSANARLSISLQSQIDHLNEEYGKLKEENDKLKAQISSNATKLAGEMSKENAELITILEEKHTKLKSEKREIEDKMHEMEGKLETLQPMVRELTIENEDLKQSLKEFNLLQTQIQTLREDNECWKQKAEKATFDSTILEKKEREIKDLNSEVKILNSRLEHHVKLSSADEDNKNEIKDLRQQIGTLNSVLDQKELEITLTKGLVSKLESELIAAKESLAAYDNKQFQLEKERDELEEKLYMASQVTDRSLHDSLFDGKHLSFENGENSILLEVENKRLKERIQELEELENLNGKILTLNNQKEKVENEKLILEKQNQDLTSEIARCKESLKKMQEKLSEDVGELKVKLEKSFLNEQQAKEKAKQAEEALDAKTVELKEMEDTLRRSKSLVDEMEKFYGNNGREDINSVQQFKQQKHENEMLQKQVETLNAELNNVRTIYEQENRLLSTSAYRMVVDRNEEKMYLSQSERASAGKESQTSGSLLLQQKESSALLWSVVAILVFIVMCAEAFKINEMPPTA